MKQILTILLSILASFVATAQTGKKLMVIVAHPDDESALAEVLIKYRKLGARVQVVIATDGKDGTRVTSIPAGDSLGGLRKLESACACEMMGIEKPIFLGVERLDTKIGVGKYFAAHKILLTKLKETISAFNPDFILTFGPDGDTHHSEHIVIGASVTELLLMEKWVDRYPLYYLAWTASQGKLFDLGYVADEYFNVTIGYTQADEDAALAIMPCYRTQYTPQELIEDRKLKQEDKTNALNFRRLSVNRQEKKKAF